MQAVHVHSHKAKLFGIKQPYSEGPSILAADSEEEPSSEEGSDLEDNRPSLLPLDEVIRTVPISLSSLLEVMVPRLQQKSEVKGVSPNDQQSFVSILVGELSCQFSDLKQQIDDPFLTRQKNRTLHRLVAVKVCQILEDLYGDYIAKAARLPEDGTLSIAAHMSRLRAQLAIQASKSINLPAIRHQVLSQLRGPLPTSRPSRLPPVPRWQPPHTVTEKINLDSLDLGAPLSSKLPWLSRSGSGVLRRRRVQKLAAGMTHRDHRDDGRTTISTTEANDAEEEADESSAVDQPVTLASSSDQLFKHHRAPSMPELYSNFLLYDWKLLSRSPYHIASPTGDQRRERRHQVLRTARRSSIGSCVAHDGLKWTSEHTKVEKRLGDYTREDLKSDLHQLSELEPSFIHSVAPDDIDPLLQACVHGLSKRQRSRLEAHDMRERKRREEEEQRRREEEEERERRERQAVPTLEHMEKMQYLREQTPQSISHSHASLHVRSNASDYLQTHSRAPSQYNSSIMGLDMSAPDIEVDHWSDGGAETLSQANTTASGSAVSDPGLLDTGILQSVAASGLLHLGSDDIMPLTQHGSTNNELLPKSISQRSKLYSTSSLIPESPIDVHSDCHILEPVSQRPHVPDLSSSGLILEPASSQHMHDSSVLLNTLHQLHGNYPSLTSRSSSNSRLNADSLLLTERPRQRSGSSSNRHTPGSDDMWSQESMARGRESSATGDDSAGDCVSSAGDCTNNDGSTGDVASGDGGAGDCANGDISADDCASGDGASGSAGDQPSNGTGGMGQPSSISDMKSFSCNTFSDVESHKEREAVEHESEEQVHQPQPAVITTRFNDKVIRSSDMCVSERRPLATLRLKPYGPIWNELTGELDRKTIDELDSNLTEGEEMDYLYHELMKTIPKDYLDMENAPSLIPAAEEPVDLSSVLASSSLPHRPSRRVVNPDLRPVSQLAPPWGDKTNREQWKKSNLYTGPDPKELMVPKGSTLTPAQARQRQQYQNWLRRWRSTVSPDDYLKFVAQTESDYLHHVYHLYDSEGSESEAEEEKERRERLVRLHSKLQAKQAKCAERYRRKTRYEKGVWNVNAVLMGGLGGDPHSSGSSSDEDIEDQLRLLERNGKEPEEGIQQSLQAVWSRLQLSQEQRIEMAIKYCSHQHKQQARKAISLWESACDVIEQREAKLEQLQNFEKSASDPSHLFAKGYDGSRLQEAKTRKQIHSALDKLDSKLSHTLRKLQSRFGDVVTYKGRPYHEKTRHDRTEVLYRPQQEQRTAQVTNHSTHDNVKL